MQIYNLFCFPQNIFKANFDFNTDDATCFEYVQFPTAQIHLTYFVQTASAQLGIILIVQLRLHKFNKYLTCVCQGTVSCQYCCYSLLSASL